MIPLLRVVASALAAVLLGWLLPASAGAAVDVPLVAYTYDAAHIQAAPAHDRVERAPPTTRAVLPLHLASDRGWSVAPAWPETIYNTRNFSYDQSVLLVPTDSSAAGGEATRSGAPEMVPRMGWERAYSIRATGVAAKTADNLLPGLPASATKPLGLGSTGRTAPGNLTEQLAMTEVRSAPGGRVLSKVTMTDPRWTASDGWVKMQQIVNGVNVHYVRNTATGAVDDFKFVMRR